MKKIVSTSSLRVLFTLLAAVMTLSASAQGIEIQNSSNEVVASYGSGYKAVLKKTPTLPEGLTLTLDKTYIQLLSASITSSTAGTATLTATVPENATVQWSVSGSSVSVGIPTITTTTSAVTITASASGPSIITATAILNGKTTVASCTVDVDYVDLGLPSGTKWALCNVGATAAEGYGNYYAWGETTTQAETDYSWSTYKWMDHTGTYKDSWAGCQKYTFADLQTNTCWYSGSTYVGTTVGGVTYKDLRTLDPADDAATANWGSNWCMPTLAQQQELVNSSYTTTTWTTQNGVNGRVITSKMSGYTDKSIFLPAAGCRFGGGLHRVGSNGGYWSSELLPTYSDVAWDLYFGSSSVQTGIDGTRFWGWSVRPVCSAQ